MNSTNIPNQNNNKSDLDDFPIYDEVIKADTLKLSGIWRDFLATFKENLSGYLSSGGIFLPNITTTQRNQLLNVQNGQMIYNVTASTAQYYSAGSWINFP